MTNGESPLRGVRVVEVGSTLSAPYCTMLLGQLGADVVKVEPPEGDITRRIGPARTPGMSAMFLGLNADKLSVVLDLDDAGGRRSLRALVLTSDVVIHNLRPQTALRVGLEPRVVLDAHPTAVLCAIQGFASGTADEHKPAYDDIIQAASGMISLQELLSGSPSYVATVLADKTAGMMAAIAVLAALHRREQTGEGVSIEVPMLDVMTSMALVEHVSGEAFEPALGPSLYGRTMSPHRGPYRTADGWLSVTVYTPAHWDRFLTYVGRAEVLRDPRFADVSSRAANIDQLYAIVAEVIMTRTTEEWIEILESLDVPSSEVRDAREILAERGPTAFLVSEHHPTEGQLRSLPHPVRYNGRQPSRSRPAPRLGQHTDEVLESLGIEGVR